MQHKYRARSNYRVPATLTIARTRTPNATDYQPGLLKPWLALGGGGGSCAGISSSSESSSESVSVLELTSIAVERASAFIGL